MTDLGLDSQIAEHNEMKGLSGGQKVKVVIAAAMWSKPQLLILDEPTNFLDRDALGGLATAIRDWAGAFICISHNAEFVGALCPEIWDVQNGVLTLKVRALPLSGLVADTGQGKVGIVEDAFEDTPKSSKPNSRVSSQRGKSRTATTTSSPADSPGVSAANSAANSSNEADANGLPMPVVAKKKMTRVRPCGLASDPDHARRRTSRRGKSADDCARSPGSPRPSRGPSASPIRVSTRTSTRLTCPATTTTPRF